MGADQRELVKPKMKIVLIAESNSLQESEEC